VNDQAKPKQISYLPTDGLSYDPTEEKYWDEGALDKEIRRPGFPERGRRPLHQPQISHPHPVVIESIIALKY